MAISKGNLPALPAGFNRRKCNSWPRVGLKPAVSATAPSTQMPIKW